MFILAETISGVRQGFQWRLGAVFSVGVFVIAGVGLGFWSEVKRCLLPPLCVTRGKFFPRSGRIGIMSGMAVGLQGGRHGERVLGGLIGCESGTFGKIEHN